MTYPNQLFSAFSFICFVLSAIPLYWHLEAWNVGTSLYMAWVGLGCLNAFINSVVWNNTVLNVAPVWCDISTRFIVGLNVGLPTALLVINYRLFKIASSTTTSSTRAEKRRALFIDLAIGLGIPLLQMILEMVVEGHRFDIFEEVGCLPAIYNVTLAFPLVYVWPLIIGLITVFYGCLNIRIFWKSSRQFRGMVVSNKNPNQNRYIRLIALSCTQAILTLPLHFYQIYFSIFVGVQPWISWANTHSDYSRVGQFPSIIWRATPTAEASLEINRWLIITSAVVFFAFFGFAEEARKHYRLAYTVATQRLHLSGLSFSRNSTRSLTSSFGPGLRKGAAASAGSTLRSYNWPGTMKERDVSTMVSDRRLTSDSSIFEDADDEPKAVELLPDEDDFHPAPATQTAVIVLPTISRAPVPPSPTANSGGAVLSIPPDRINSPLPHRPISSYLDLCDNV